MDSAINSYIQSIHRQIQHIDTSEIKKAAEALVDAYINQTNIYVFGNGACAALASHMAGDLGKISALDLGQGPSVVSMKRLKITSLTDNNAWITALGNDVSYNDIFLEQLKTFLSPGDLVIGLSGSGSSTNVIRALQYANTIGAKVLSLTSTRDSAETIRKISDICIASPSTMMEQIEDFHVMFHHILARLLRDSIEEIEFNKNTLEMAS